jgi:hypothetical protein
MLCRILKGMESSELNIESTLKLSIDSNDTKS